MSGPTYTLGTETAPMSVAYPTTTGRSPIMPRPPFVDSLESKNTMTTNAFKACTSTDGSFGLSSGNRWM